MRRDEFFQVKSYDFDSNILNEFQNNQYAKNHWPIVYILTDGKIREAYVGETTDTYARMTAHLNNKSKSKLTVVHLITSEKFNKSATLDIESNLIKYFSGDGQYLLQNLTIGLDHNYYQKQEVYWNIFRSIWNELIRGRIAKHSIDSIDNSDLFKYSPYKSLTNDQKRSLIEILEILSKNDSKNIIVEGGAGTGKTILAVFLFKLLNTNIEDFSFQEFGENESKLIELVKRLKAEYPTPKMALVVPMSSFRATLKKVFKNIKGLYSNMVIGPAEIARHKYDIVLVDESHRLRRRVNLGTYFNAFDRACKKLDIKKDNPNELDWILKQSKKAVFFYDENQSIKPSDVRKSDFYKLMKDKSTKITKLKSQFRVRGGDDYVEYVDRLLGCSIIPGEKKFTSKSYEFFLFDSIEKMIEEIKYRDEQGGLSRLIAGYSWEWISRKNKDQFDIEIDGIKLKWNSDTSDWIYSENAVNEVGCIHTTQGYDLNYAGIIFGNEITYNKAKNEINVLKERYFDRNGKQSIKEPSELFTYIINIYKTLMLRGIKGTFLYVCDKDLRDYFRKHIFNFNGEEEDYVPKVKLIPYINSIPLYDISVAAGDFSEQENVTEDQKIWVELPSGIKASKDLFACKVIGESMNKIIPNGSVCIFRKYYGGSRNGLIVLVEHAELQDPNSGSRFTVKEYHSKKEFKDAQWSHSSVTLKPKSYDSQYGDIELEGDEITKLKVHGTFESLLFSE